MENYPFVKMVRKYVGGSVLLIIATVGALVIANSPWGEWYRDFWQRPMSLSVGDFNLLSYHGREMTLLEFVNDFLMAVFFLSVGLEIKREVLCGELSSFKKAITPVVGAIGGMLIPILVFLIFCPDDPLMQRGMTIPIATDIAFSLGVLSIFSKRCPLSLKIFLAALAVTDDLGGIFVIAFKFSEGLSWTYLYAVFALEAILLIGNFRGVRSKSYYLFFGFIMWYCMLNSGIHATIAGVMLAFSLPANVPVGSSFYIERIRKNLSAFPHTEVSKADRNKATVLTDDEIFILKHMESDADHLISPLQDLEDSLKVPVNYYIIPIFAFANAGVNLEGMSMMNLFTGIGLAVFMGLVIGKFIGVFGITWIFTKLRLIRKPEGSTWASFAGICMLCGIGFTVSMFMTALSYPVHHTDYLNDAKLGIICGSIVSAILGSLILHYTLPKEHTQESLVTSD